MSDYSSFGFFYHKNITIRASAIISLSDVMYEEQSEEDIEEGLVKYGMFTVTLINGYPVTFRGASGEIELEHKEFLKNMLYCEAASSTNVRIQST